MEWEEFLAWLRTPPAEQATGDPSTTPRRAPSKAQAILAQAQAQVGSEGAAFAAFMQG